MLPAGRSATTNDLRPIDFQGVKPPFEPSPLSQRIVYLVASIFTLGALHWISRNLIPRTVLQAWTTNGKDYSLALNIFACNNVGRYEPFKIKTYEGAVLNGCILSPKIKSDKYWIYVPGNGERYEARLSKETLTRADKIQANILLFNYQGIGNDSPFPSKEEDFFTDAATCIQFLKSKGIPEENIGVYGHSLGGAAGIQAARCYPEVAFVSQSSFSSLPEIASHIFTKCCAQSICGTVIRFILANFVKIAMWPMDSFTAWQKMKNKRRVIFYHPKDQVILRPASLYKRVKEAASAKANTTYEGTSKGQPKTRLREEEKPPCLKAAYILEGMEGFDFHNQPLDGNFATNETINAYYQKMRDIWKHQNTEVRIQNSEGGQQH